MPVYVWLMTAHQLSRYPTRPPRAGGGVLWSEARDRVNGWLIGWCVGGGQLFAHRWPSLSAPPRLITPPKPQPLPSLSLLATLLLPLSRHKQTRKYNLCFTCHCPPPPSAAGPAHPTPFAIPATYCMSAQPFLATLDRHPPRQNSAFSAPDCNLFAAHLTQPRLPSCISFTRFPLSEPASFCSN